MELCGQDKGNNPAHVFYPLDQNTPSFVHHQKHLRGLPEYRCVALAPPLQIRSSVMIPGDSIFKNVLGEIHKNELYFRTCTFGV